MVQQTSLYSFFGIKDLGYRQEQVYNTINRLGEASNLDIAKTLHLPINSITPRTNELVQKGHVEVSRIGRSQWTGKKVIFWKIKK